MSTTPLQPYEIDISGLDPAEMIAALWNAAKKQFFDTRPDMTPEEAQRHIDRLLAMDGQRLYFDYLEERPMKVHFGRPILDTRLFDRDAGPGAAAAALAPLLNSQPSQS